MLCYAVLWATMSSLVFFGEVPVLLLFVDAESVSFSVCCRTSCLVIIAYLWDALFAARSARSFAKDFSSCVSWVCISVFY